MKYCSQCGSLVTFRIPENDNLPRYICDSCNTIHYQNPKIVAGCIANWEDKVLLCKRAIEPRYGLWTLPAGFMENKETTLQAAKRETMEEANADVLIHGLYALFNIPHISQVYVMFRGSLQSLDYKAGIESLEVNLFHEHEIPWDEIAFPVVRETLQRYFRDRVNDEYPIHVGDIHPQTKT